MALAPDGLCRAGIETKDLSPAPFFLFNCRKIYSSALSKAVISSRKTLAAAVAAIFSRLA